MTSRHESIEEKTILIVDDDETILEVARTILEQANFKIITAANGPEGIALAKGSAPDLILLDRQMPEMHGIECLEKLKKDADTSNIPVIMLTGDNAIADLGESMQKGAKNYIVKPFTSDLLINLVQQELLGRDEAIEIDLE